MKIHIAAALAVAAACGWSAAASADADRGKVKAFQADLRAECRLMDGEIQQDCKAEVIEVNACRLRGEDVDGCIDASRKRLDAKIEAIGGWQKIEAKAEIEELVADIRQRTQSALNRFGREPIVEFDADFAEVVARRRALLFATKQCILFDQGKLSETHRGALTGFGIAQWCFEQAEAGAFPSVVADFQLSMMKCLEKEKGFPARAGISFKVAQKVEVCEEDVVIDMLDAGPTEEERRRIAEFYDIENGIKQEAQ